MGDTDKKGEALWVGLAGVAVFAISAGVLSIVLLRNQSPTFGQVAALILVGFAAFIILMNVLSFTAFVLGIGNNTQPFGLPEGSVRAVLTLSLIVLVGVLASFLITGGNRSVWQESRVQRNAELQQANDFVKAHPELTTSITILDAEDDKSTGATADKKLYDVVVKTKVEDKLSEDISKQILTMLSTILAAMIGFYFGAKTDSGVAGARSDQTPAADGAKAPDPAGAAKLKAIDDKVAALEQSLGAGTAERQTLDTIKTDLAQVRTDLKAANDKLAGTGLSDADRSQVTADRQQATKDLDAISDRLGKLEGK